MKLEVWVKDDQYFKGLIRDLTQRDGKWRVTCKRDGKRIVHFTGAQGAERATLFKLAYVEPKGPVTPPVDKFKELQRLVKAMTDLNDALEAEPETFSKSWKLVRGNHD